MPAEPWNTFHAGDNLDVLPRLAPGSVDLVYTDPPYNTGNDFAYADRFRDHAAWTAMMRPRLVAVREVLAPHGAIFVSIDDNEAAHLRLLMDEVFGEANFLAQIVVNLNPKGRQLGRGFATSHEYVLAYARHLPSCVVEGSSTEAVDEADFPLTAPDGRRFRYLPLRNTNKKFNPLTAPTLHFELYGDPVSGRVATTPFDGSRALTPVFGDGRPAVWRWSRPRVDEQPDDLECRVIRGRTGERVDIFQRDWLEREGGRRKKLRTIWLAEEIGSTDTAVAELKALARARLRVAQADRARPPDPVDRAQRRRRARPVRRQRHHRPRGRPRQRRRRRHPPLHQHQLHRADPRGLQRPASPASRPSPTSPAPGSPPSPSRSAAGSDVVG